MSKNRKEIFASLFFSRPVWLEELITICIYSFCVIITLSFGKAYAQSIGDIPTLSLNQSLVTLVFPQREIRNFVSIAEEETPLTGDAVAAGNVFWYFVQKYTDYTEKDKTEVIGYRWNENALRLEKTGGLALPNYFYARPSGQIVRALHYGLETGNDRFLAVTALDIRFPKGFYSPENISPEGGLYIVDVSSPQSPALAYHIPAVDAGGTSLIGNRLFARIALLDGDYQNDYMACYDMENLYAPRELWRVPVDRYYYCADIDSNDSSILYAGGSSLLVLKFDDDSVEIIAKWEFPIPVGNIFYLKAYPNYLLLGGALDNSTLTSPGFSRVLTHAISLDQPAQPGTVRSAILQSRENAHTTFTNMYGFPSNVIVNTAGECPGFFSLHFGEDASIEPIAFHPTKSSMSSILWNDFLFFGAKPVNMISTAQFFDAAIPCWEFY
ncbi:MAG: hypothetical protein AB1656_21455 [Candidatus Omnitrophota bacterium]